MQSVQKLGGIGALVAAGSFVVGLTLLATVFAGFVSTSDPADAVEFIMIQRLCRGELPRVEGGYEEHKRRFRACLDASTRNEREVVMGYEALLETPVKDVCRSSP